MLVKYLDGQTYEWKIKGREVTKDYRPRSELHVLARDIIKERFPTMQVLEEVPIQPYKGKTLYLDFYIPLIRLAIEVHGEQHFKFSSLFHSSTRDFIKQQSNDEDKKNWCEQNGIGLIIFKYDEKDQWADLIK